MEVLLIEEKLSLTEKFLLVEKLLFAFLEPSTTDAAKVALWEFFEAFNIGIIDNSLRDGSGEVIMRGEGFAGKEVAICIFGANYYR